MESTKSDSFALEMVSIRLVKDFPLLSDRRILGPEDTIEVVGKYICDMDREVVCVINLDTAGHPINGNIVSIGALNLSIVSPRELLKSTILSNAANVIVIHNHPSGNLEPSKADIDMTKKILQIYKMIDVNILDHLIVGRDTEQFYSFKENIMMPYLDIDYSFDKKADFYKPGVDVKSKIESAIANRNRTCRGIYADIEEVINDISTPELTSYYVNELNREEHLRDIIFDEICSIEIQKERDRAFNEITKSTSHNALNKNNKQRGGR